MKRTILSVLLAGIWITVSEFLRNELLFKSHWIDHYQSLGLEFETRPINGMLWMIWGFIMAYLIFKLLESFSFFMAMVLSWLAAFVMMWITIYNLQVLPLKLLVFAVPLSMAEVIVAGVILKKLKLE